MLAWARFSTDAAQIRPILGGSFVDRDTTFQAYSADTEFLSICDEANSPSHGLASRWIDWWNAPNTAMSTDARESTGLKMAVSQAAYTEFEYLFRGSDPNLQINDDGSMTYSPSGAYVSSLGNSSIDCLTVEMAAVSTTPGIIDRNGTAYEYIGDDDDNTTLSLRERCDALVHSLVQSKEIEVDTLYTLFAAMSHSNVTWSAVNQRTMIWTDSELGTLDPLIDFGGAIRYGIAPSGSTAMLTEVRFDSIQINDSYAYLLGNIDRCAWGWILLFCIASSAIADLLAESSTAIFAKCAGQARPSLPSENKDTILGYAARILIGLSLSASSGIYHLSFASIPLVIGELPLRRRLRDPLGHVIHTLLSGHCRQKRYANRHRVVPIGHEGQAPVARPAGPIATATEVSDSRQQSPSPALPRLVPRALPVVPLAVESVQDIGEVVPEATTD